MAAIHGRCLDRENTVLENILPQLKVKTFVVADGWWLSALVAQAKFHGFISRCMCLPAFHFYFTSNIKVSSVLAILLFHIITSSVLAIL